MSLSKQKKNMSTVTKNIENLASSLDFFTCNLYQAVAVNSNENLFLSPFSIATVLSMVYLGARNNTARQLENTLNASSFKNKLHEAFHEYMNHLLSESKNVTLKSANRIYANQNLPVSDDYKTQLTKFYLSTIESVDFDKKAVETKDAINDWVEQYTNGKIKNLIPDNVLTRDTLLVLINAIYFKGNWAEKFPKEATSKREFLLGPGQQIEHDMMYISDKYFIKMDADMHCKILELPYSGNKLSMFVILPDQIDGLGSLEQRLKPEFFQSMLQLKGFRKREVEVFLPKFRLESRFEMKDILSEMGLSDLFDKEKSDLSAMVSEKRRVYVSKVIHKAFVEVNEEGTEAAAATAGLVMCLMSMEIGIEFKADHPFLFTIVDKQSQTVLFIGRVTNPQV